MDRIDDRPVVFVYAVDSQKLETWQEIFADLNRSGYNGFYIADTSNVAYLQVFDGIHVYESLFAFKDLNAGDEALSLSVKMPSLSTQFSSRVILIGEFMANVFFRWYRTSNFFELLSK